MSISNKLLNLYNVGAASGIHTAEAEPFVLDLVEVDDSLPYL